MNFTTLSVKKETAEKIRLIKAIKRHKNFDETIRWLIEKTETNKSQEGTETTTDHTISE